MSLNITMFTLNKYYMLKIDRTVFRIHINIILFARSSFHYPLQFITIHNNVNNFGQPFEMPKLIILYLKIKQI